MLPLACGPGTVVPKVCGPYPTGLLKGWDPLASRETKEVQGWSAAPWPPAGWEGAQYQGAGISLPDIRYRRTSAEVAMGLGTSDPPDVGLELSHDDKPCTML